MLHALATLMMTGIIWFVQVVHYPLFSLVGKSNFGLYILHNRVRTAVVTVPIMLVEMATAFLILILPTIPVGLPIRVAGVILVIVIWSSTLLIQWPQHLKLQHGYNRKVHRRLLFSNWIRTIGWSLRSVIAIIIVHQVGFF